MVKARAGWYGFAGRVFLSDAEHDVYRRRTAVRYSARAVPKHAGICDVCGKPPAVLNPLQVAHRVPFASGILVYRLTPDWLDSLSNLVWAHRFVCNKLAELSPVAIAELVVRLQEAQQLEYVI